MLALIVVGDEEGRPNVKLTVEEILPENPDDEAKTGYSVVPPDYVDPLSQLDTEAMQSLKNALASEQAKQILGENVTAMLGKVPSLKFIARRKIKNSDWVSVLLVRLSRHRVNSVPQKK